MCIYTHRTVGDKNGGRDHGHICSVNHFWNSVDGYGDYIMRTNNMFQKHLMVHLGLHTVVFGFLVYTGYALMDLLP